MVSHSTYGIHTLLSAAAYTTECSFFLWLVHIHNHFCALCLWQHIPTTIYMYLHRGFRSYVCCREFFSVVFVCLSIVFLIWPNLLLFFVHATCELKASKNMIITCTFCSAHAVSKPNLPRDFLMFCSKLIAVCIFSFSLTIFVVVRSILPLIINTIYWMKLSLLDTGLGSLLGSFVA